MFVAPKNETKNNIPADAGHFLRTEIDSKDFKNENSTAKTRQKNLIFLKNIPKDLETDESIIKNKYLKKILDKEINQNKIAKNCWLSRYKRSR